MERQAHDEEVHQEMTPHIASLLVEHHRKFLGFLERRVESSAAAEEILQSAFVRAIEKGGSLRDDESAVAWFYRLLRNAVIDHYRRRDAAARALDKEAQEQQRRADDAYDSELENVICACLHELLTTLKPEYEQLVRAVDLDGKAVTDVARELGITGNNANVRLHRARQALKKRLESSCNTCAEHGCLDCSCERSVASHP